MVGVGLFFYKKNNSVDDYFLGGRKMSAWHIGLSVVATDVGGGFSIGLGGLGFVMGLSGSWMLFTGLLGAWISGVWLIPRIYKISALRSVFSLPDVFRYYYGIPAALIAAIISFVGYMGFTASQIVAGAKLASATFEGFDYTTLLWIMGLFTVFYTALGGLKAVIYTDTIQWMILMFGLIFLGIPFAYVAVGGWDSIQQAIPNEMLSFGNVGFVELINWFITIVPIWFVGMTLYQRIFASRNEMEAKKAWFLAGILEWPLMAFMGVVLGVLSRVAFEQGLIGFNGNIDAEMGLPLLLKEVLPAGVTGILLAAYFSAIMSTADSCLMAASGNVVTDFLGKIFRFEPIQKLRLSQWSTLILGVGAVYIAFKQKDVLELMLLSYAFMVSGLFVPMIMGVMLKKRSTWAAPLSMLSGGLTTVFLEVKEIPIYLDINANAMGIMASLVVYGLIHQLSEKTNAYF